MSVTSVSMSTQHGFSKSPTSYIYLLRNLGVQGDIHCASTPSPQNLRQVLLLPTELLSDLAKPSSKHPSFSLSPGELGENITTAGIDLTALSEGTRLFFGDREGCAVVRVTGLREPRKRLNEWPPGLLDRCKLKDGKGRTVGRKVGVMAAVETDGYVQPGHTIYIQKPKVHKALVNI